MAERERSEVIVDELRAAWVERGGEDPAELIELIRMASERIAEQEKRIHSLRLMLDQKTETWIGEETARARTAEARLDRMAEILGEVEATPGLSESPDLLQKVRSAIESLERAKAERGDRG